MVNEQVPVAVAEAVHELGYPWFIKCDVFVVMMLPYHIINFARLNIERCYLA